MTTRLSKAYLLTKVLTASRQEIVVYLYEGAIGYLQRAIHDLENGHAEEAAGAIERVVSIVVELSGNLNYNAPGQGQLALRLDSIYNYLIESLTLASGRGDVDALKACEGILGILHDAWQQAVALDEQGGVRAESRVRISA